MKQISIVGFGRFGRVMYRLLKDDFAITLFNRNKITWDTAFTAATVIASKISDIYKSEVIFYCVPIAAFADVLKQHKKYIRNHHVLIDVLSVKIHAQKLFAKHLKKCRTQALLTHPMFGPDSSRIGFVNLPIILDQFRASDETYAFWKTYFANKGLRIVEMTAQDHDKLAASSQGLTHFIGRLLETYDFKKTAIDSLGAKKLHEVVEQTCNDTWELFSNLQHFNPFTSKMRQKLGRSYDRLYNKLLPDQVAPNILTLGIQGGKGSFNEQAIRYYIKRNRLTKYKIKYLYTSEKVLAALHRGEIDRGQFAIHNSVGGVVAESIEAMAKYKFEIVEQFAIKIAHALMIRSDTKFSEITTIMTHPQILAQCKSTLLQKYPHLKLTSGKRALIDQAFVAKQLTLKKLPKNIATIGSNVLADLYGLTVIEDNLQDAKENHTSFLVVKRL